MRIARPWLFALGALFVCVLFLGAILVYAVSASPGGAPPRPLVKITGTLPDGHAVAGQPVVIFIEASDPTGIARIELWVNGQKAAAQENPDAANSLPFETSQAWVPNAPGNYLVISKAANTRNFEAESDPRVIVVGERGFVADPQLVGDYIVVEGDTWESIAAALGTTPDELRALNPGEDALTPGAALRIPPRPEGDAAGDAEDPAPPEGIADAPHVDPPAPSPDTAPGGEAEAEPAPGMWWGPLPIPDGFMCTLNPALCARPLEGLPPPAPSGVDVRAAAGCGVDVSWVDESDDEVGFRLYRITNRPRFRFDLVETFTASPGSGRRLSYLDAAPPRGTFWYTVVAYNAGGTTWSPPSAEITSEGCRTEFVGLAAVVEGLSMETAGSFDRLYCYASLADAPFERVPRGASNFIALEAGAWNIAEHFSGSNKRPVFVYGDALNIVVECLAWQGGELINLGRFTRSHPRAEWDGRILSATSDSGGYTVTYRINEGYETADAETGRALWPLVDGSLPVPYNLRTAAQWSDCRRSAEDVIACGLTEEPALAWDYTVAAASPRPALAYKVYRRLDGEDVPALYHTATAPSRSAPQAPGGCERTVFYSVSAVVGVDMLTGEEIQSPPSAELMVPPSCASLEITLNTLWVYGVYDGDPCTVFGDCRDDYEAYGWLMFNGHRFTWNNHCDPGFGEGCLSGGAPSYSTLLEASGHDWSAFSLNTGDGWGRGNNVIRIPIHDAEALVLRFQLIDHDDHSDDELWCGTEGRRTLRMLEPRSAADWLAFDEVLTVDGNDTLLGACIVDFRVRGLPAGAP
jgi:hypothetical protein